MKLSDIARLAGPEETLSMKAERHRRSREIHAGRHPDTGKRLTLADRKTLKPGDLFEFQMWKETRLMGPAWQWNEFERATAKWREHQDLNNRVHFLGSSLSDVNRAVSEKLVGPTLDDRIRTLTERGYADPTINRHWEINSTSRVGFELAGRPELCGSSQLHEVDRVMTTQVTSFLREQSELLRYQSARPFVTNFIQDVVMMEREATRMLGIYGRSLVEQPLFLTEYRSNLDLFQFHRPSDSVFQAADLLARVALPTDLIPGFQFYEIQQVRRLEAYANAQLLEVEEDFEFDGNPVHVWKAIDIALSAGMDLPIWAAEKLSEMAERICEIGDREGSKGRLTEAELVGRAVGFGKGKGETGQFAGARQLQRDREIYFAVEDWLANERLRRPDGGAKLSSAYSAVAEQFGVNTSTVQRAYQRIKNYVGNDE
jgi:hypothetical protein